MANEEWRENNVGEVDYRRLWHTLVREPSRAKDLIDQVFEEVLLKMMQTFGPSNADWVIEGDHWRQPDFADVPDP